jgi:hypothetical protein
LSASRAKNKQPKDNQKYALFAFRSWSDNGATEQKFRDGSLFRRLIQIPANGSFNVQSAPRTKAMLFGFFVI